MLVPSQRLIFASISGHHLGDLELGHVVQLLIIVEGHFIATSFLKWFLCVEPVVLSVGCAKERVCGCVSFGGICVGRDSGFGWIIMGN